VMTAQLLEPRAARRGDLDASSRFAIGHQLAQPEHVLGAARPPAQRVSCGGWLTLSVIGESNRATPAR
jgi:hypothetical protein